MNTLLEHQFSYILDTSGAADEISASQKGMCHVELVITFSGLWKFFVTLKIIYIYNCNSQSKVIRCNSRINQNTQLDVFTQTVI
jgi:hypothetical protein